MSPRIQRESGWNCQPALRSIAMQVGILTIIGYPVSLYAQAVVPGPVQPSNQQPLDFKGYPKQVPPGTNANPPSAPVDNTKKINELQRMNKGNQEVIQHIQNSNNPTRMAPAQLYYQQRINNTNQKIEELQNQPK